ncbi:FMN-linked oxidoreductase [Cantharellus anzutake]|uniref:FMN-linked oxidoreductase n=1 Tax=Cantharellus anzutake TaxID=1750568 RepID=UPI0019070EC2|nr:FMN-linked oxidoreductase [Cantharellus anzutake]KAF8333982.1 FMN-linked oxidoreductase [Cantharellus anzutake]
MSSCASPPAKSLPEFPPVDGNDRFRAPGGLLPNKHVPNANEYYPLSEPAPGTALPVDEYPQNKDLPILFQPLTIRGVTFKNRLWVAPMCVYSAVNGLMTDWHLVHLGSFAIQGTGNVGVEATAVTAEGRTCPEDPGIWSDEHIPQLKRVVDFVHAQGTTIGIQLAHAGRKASTRAPWAQEDIHREDRNPKSHVATSEEGGWPDQVFAPSTIQFIPMYPKPKALTQEQIEEIVEAFGVAARRAKQAGFDYVEIHAAHGYLIHEFFSPLANVRTDKYGGSFENRVRIGLDIAKRVRAEVGESYPVFYRISGTDWAEGPEKDESSGEWRQWGVEQSSQLTRLLKDQAGVDLVDISSGGLWIGQKIPIKPNYQIPLSEYIKKQNPDVLIGGVGLITNGKQAEEILQKGQADVIRAGREYLRNPALTLHSAMQLGVVAKPANQYEYAWTRMVHPNIIMVHSEESRPEYPIGGGIRAAEISKLDTARKLDHLSAMQITLYAYR